MSASSTSSESEQVAALARPPVGHARSEGGERRQIEDIVETEADMPRSHELGNVLDLVDILNSSILLRLAMATGQK